MLVLAQFKTISKIFERFGEALGPGMFAGMLVLLGITFFILAGRRTHVALLCVLCLALLTVAQNEAIASLAQLGRWYFLALAAVVALMRPGPGRPLLVALLVIYALFNLVGVVYTPDFESGLVRAIFYVLAIPAFLLSLGPPAHTIESQLRFVRLLGLVGVVLALLHAYFVGLAPQGRGIQRFASFYESSQLMSLGTATVTLPMIWVLLSKRAGRLFLPFLVATLVNLTVMIASTQRAGLFSLAGATAILLVFYRARGALIALAGGTAFVLIAWPIVTFLVSEEFLMQRFGSFEAKGRAYYWQIAVEEGSKSPIIGHGSGAATDYARKHFGKKFHQAYLAIFYDFGLLGLSAFIAMIVVAMVYAFRLARSRDPDRKALGVFLLASLAQVAAQGLVETGLADTANQTATLFYLSLGLVAGAMRVPERRAQPRYVFIPQPPPVPPHRQHPPGPLPAIGSPPK